ncbi:MAG: pyridoxamine 5'-phosphate oxidase family protein [Proteobacteria bacterium]|nr:pyridoxamine 5'-phosphate oxidase family protein [Pseudomonadota bacterium]NIS68615.1 pyridoxamine 5'-phosphate oxidase family protein [Pseudomonadota bacterium]
MKPTDYFEQTTGRGVLATADSSGKVDAALYARPHFIDDQTLVFIMTDRLTHRNLQSNPHAVYLFIESGKKLIGRRFYLTKIKEEKNSKLIPVLRRRKNLLAGKKEKGPKYLVYFRVEKTLPLIGEGKERLRGT